MQIIKARSQLYSEICEFIIGVQSRDASASEILSLTEADHVYYKVNLVDLIGDLSANKEVNFLDNAAILSIIKLVLMDSFCPLLLIFKEYYLDFTHSSKGVTSLEIRSSDLHPTLVDNWLMSFCFTCYVLILTHC